jgi:hypothetical protein
MPDSCKKKNQKVGDYKDPRNKIRHGSQFNFIPLLVSSPWPFHQIYVSSSQGDHKPEMQVIIRLSIYNRSLA